MTPEYIKQMEQIRRLADQADTVSYPFTFGEQTEFVKFGGMLARALGENGKKAWDAMYNEVQAMLGRFTRVVTEDELTRALWETDPEVKSFIRQKKDDFIRLGPGVCSMKFGHWQRTADIAWARREPVGSIERARNRAAETIQTISRIRTSLPISTGNGDAKT